MGAVKGLRPGDIRQAREKTAGAGDERNFWERRHSQIPTLRLFRFVDGVIERAGRESGRVTRYMPGRECSVGPSVDTPTQK